MDHSIIKEMDQRDFCPYCRNGLNGDRWDSEWHSDIHYKTICCSSCSKRVSIRVDFDGDGNDFWDGELQLSASNDDSPLEVKINDIGLPIKPVKN